MKLGTKLRILLFVKPPGWIRKISSSMIWRIPVEEPVLFLTFDDGPVPELTEWILEELQKYGARATFFCVGENVKKNPEVYAKILEAGNAVGNHTFSHLNSYRTGLRRFVKDVYKARKVIDSRLVRPPYGRIRPWAARILMPRFRIVLWDVLSMDYDRELEPRMVMYNVVSKARPGSIIVFHDNLKARKNLEYALPRVLDHYSRAGYKFLALDEKKLLKPIS
ncbi:MAG: polysaccharide deacetylase family protein [Bacteroidia bacterium]|nr:polysaccharide deacetylase family protein [Bacteroidia bacterium]